MSVYLYGRLSSMNDLIVGAVEVDDERFRACFFQHWREFLEGPHGCNDLRRLESHYCGVCGVRPIRTFSPCDSMYFAIAKPNPELAPVMTQTRGSVIVPFGSEEDDIDEEES